MSDYVKTDVSGESMKVLVARPTGSGGPWPVIALMHHKGGIDEFPRAHAERLAREGYIVAVPELYHRTPGLPPDQALRALRDPEIIADIAATLDLVAATENVRPGANAILGHCMGGRLAFLGAIADRRFRAAVAYYSGNMFTPWGGDGPSPFERLGELHCPVAGFYGNEDKNPSPADVDKIDAELTRLGIRHTFHRYDKTGHAFQNFANAEGYRPAAAEDAWQKTLRFLADELAA